MRAKSRISFPGYVAYKSSVSGGELRGGTVVLEKSTLHRAVLDTYTSAVDHGWLRLDCLPGVQLGLVYVPPRGYPYCNQTLFSAAQERIRSARPSTECVIMGDTNTMFGESVWSLPWSLIVPNAHIYTYPHIPDSVRNANDNARTLAAFCPLLSEEIDL